MARSRNRSSSTRNRVLDTSRLSLPDVLVSSPVQLDELVYGDIGGLVYEAPFSSPYEPVSPKKPSPQKFRDLRYRANHQIRSDAISPCESRHQRREVLFAKKKTRAGRGKRKRWTKWSAFKCSGK